MLEEQPYGRRVDTLSQAFAVEIREGERVEIKVNQTVVLEFIAPFDGKISTYLNRKKAGYTQRDGFGQPM